MCSDTCTHGAYVYWATITEALHYSSNFNLTIHQLIAWFCSAIRLRLNSTLTFNKCRTARSPGSPRSAKIQDKKKLTITACWTYYCSRRHSPLLASSCQLSICIDLWNCAAERIASNTLSMIASILVGSCIKSKLEFDNGQAVLQHVQAEW